MYCPIHKELKNEFVNNEKFLLWPKCGQTCTRLWTLDSLAVEMEFTAGFDRAADKHFDTKRQRDKYLKDNNLRKIRD